MTAIFWLFKMNTRGPNVNSPNAPVSVHQVPCVCSPRPSTIRTNLPPTWKPPTAIRNAGPPPGCDEYYRPQLITIPAPTPRGTEVYVKEMVTLRSSRVRNRQRDSLFLDPSFVNHYRTIGKVLGFLLGCMQIICTLPGIVFMGESCHVMNTENTILVIFSGCVTIIIGLAFGVLPGLFFKLSYLIICLYQIGDSIAVLISRPCEDIAALTSIRIVLNVICIIKLAIIWKRL